MAVSIQELVEASKSSDLKANELQIKDAETELNWFEKTLNDEVNAKISYYSNGCNHKRLTFDITEYISQNSSFFRVYQFAGKKICFSVHNDFYYKLLLEADGKSKETSIPDLSLLIANEVSRLRAMLNNAERFIDFETKKHFEDEYKNGCSTRRVNFSASALKEESSLLKMVYVVNGAFYGQNNGPSKNIFIVEINKENGKIKCSYNNGSCCTEETLALYIYIAYRDSLLS